MAIVLQHRQSVGVDQPARRVAGDEIHLALGQGAIDQRQIHRRRRRAEVQPVGLRQARDSRRRAAGTRSRSRPATSRRTRPTSPIVFRLQPRASSPRTRIANVFSNPSGSSSVSPPRAYRCRIASSTRRGSVCDRLMEDGRQRRAGVLDVDIDVARAERPIADERAAQVQPALDRQRRLRLDRLRQDLAEDDLLGEVLRPDPDHVAGRPQRRVRHGTGGQRAPTDGRRTRPRDRRGAAVRSLADAALEQRQRAVDRSARAAPPEPRRRGSPSARPSTGRERCIRRGRRRRPRRQSSRCPRRSPPPRGCRRRSTAAPAAARTRRSSWPGVIPIAVPGSTSDAIDRAHARRRSCG